MDNTERLIFNIMKELTVAIPILEVDMNEQLRVRSAIERGIYEGNFEITARCTDLVASDLPQYIEYYIACKKLKGLVDSTLKSYSRLLIKFSDVVCKPCRMITTLDIRMFLAKECEKNGGETKNNKLITLNDFFEFLKDEGVLTQNPCHNMGKIKFTKKTRKPFSNEEQEIMRLACETTREKLLFEMLISTGCRISELVKAKLGNINMSDRTLEVIGAKGDKDRIVRFSTRAKLLLEQYLRERLGNSDSLFVSTRIPHKGVGIRILQKEVKSIEARCGMEINACCHRFRNTLATNCITKGVGINTVKELLGHSNINTTTRYITVSNDTINTDYAKVYN